MLHELQVILEDLRNQLTIIKAYAQINDNFDDLYQKMLLDPIDNADNLTDEALHILGMTRYRDTV